MMMKAVVNVNIPDIRELLCDEYGFTQEHYSHLKNSARRHYMKLSRQPLYLKLTLPADADIPLVRDNP
ncbi:hypothetical protein ACLET9_24085, partial [Escherichia coli]